MIRATAAADSTPMTRGTRLQGVARGVTGLEVLHGTRESVVARVRGVHSAEMVGQDEYRRWSSPFTHWRIFGHDTALVSSSRLRQTWMMSYSVPLAPN